MNFNILLLDKNKKYIPPLQYIFNFALIKFELLKVKERLESNELLRLIADAKHIMLTGHVNPDGDSIGSLVGVGRYLQELGKDVSAVVPNRFPDYLGFLDPENEILIYSENPDRVRETIDGTDLIICLDFNGLKRIERLGELIGRSPVSKVLIDHHPQPENLFALVFSETEVSSTCELAYRIFKNLAPGKKISPESGRAFYTGMMTDTNNFANSVWPSTFRMAAELLELGVDKEDIQSRVLWSFAEGRMRLMGYMLHENMKIFPQYRAGLMILTKEMKERFGYEDGDSEGFVNLPLGIREVEVSALFTESDDFIRVSLRSKGDISVNRLSRLYFNGGGHERAAGGKLYIPVSEVEEYFKKSVGEFMGKEK